MIVNFAIATNRTKRFDRALKISFGLIYKVIQTIFQAFMTIVPNQIVRNKETERNINSHSTCLSRKSQSVLKRFHCCCFHFFAFFPQHSLVILLYFNSRKVKNSFVCESVFDDFSFVHPNALA
jgi:hypothetical protein